MWFNVLEQSPTSFTRTISKFLWHDANIVRHKVLWGMILMQNVQISNKRGWHCVWNLAKTILSKLVNTSLILIFLGVLEQRFGEYVKTDFYIIWINVFLLWQNSFCLKKECLKSLKDNFLWRDRHGYILTFWLDLIGL